MIVVMNLHAKHRLRCSPALRSAIWEGTMERGPDGRREFKRGAISEAFIDSRIRSILSFDCNRLVHQSTS